MAPKQPTQYSSYLISIPNNDRGFLINFLIKMKKRSSLTLTQNFKISILFLRFPPLCPLRPLWFT
jgi:hypothetical protein